MKILFIGDIIGRAGRETVKKVLPDIIKEHSPDLIFANAENLTHGNGFSPNHIAEMQEAGINYFTAGNHVWGNKTGVMKLDDPDFPVLRPANYPSDDTPGRGYTIINKILLINLLGQVFMKVYPDSPFKIIDKILAETAHKKLSGIIIDFHAETTSEKHAIAFYLDGKVSAVIGTHTHVPTADERILENGTAYISDAGMTGAIDSIIGVRKDIIIKRFITQIPGKHDPESEGTMSFNAVLVELDETTQKALTILRIQKYLKP